MLDGRFQTSESQYLRMVIITLQRKKCIGCNYCVELAPKQFQMSKKDGKSVLLHSSDKKGYLIFLDTDDIYRAGLFGLNGIFQNIVDDKVIVDTCFFCHANFQLRFLESLLDD